MSNHANTTIISAAIITGLIVCGIVVIGVYLNEEDQTSLNDIIGAIDIYNDEIQQINITQRDVGMYGPAYIYYTWTEHGDVYHVENYSIFRQLIPGWHTVDVQVPVNPDKMPRIVGVRYP